MRTALPDTEKNPDDTILDSESDQHKPPVTGSHTQHGRALGGIAFIYMLATLAAVGSMLAMASLTCAPALWWQLVIANGAATLVVYLASLATSNASCYDAYWSVAPPLIALALTWDQGFEHLRQGLVLLVVWIWGVRLTRNWVYGWAGFSHEDWRYRQLAEATGSWWWLVSLLGIHGFPTAMILLGSRGLVPALSAAGRAFNPLDLIALATGLGAIALSHVADRQLHAFRARRSDRSEHLATGIWARCRHPNYLGEIGFWISVWLFALAAGDDGWSWIGPVAMVALFVGISIPMIERKLVADKPGYADYRSQVPMLVPRFR